jgi:hypothetical protein
MEAQFCRAQSNRGGGCAVDFPCRGKRQPFKCLVLCILLVTVTWTLTTVEVIHGFCNNETTTTATTTMAHVSSVENIMTHLTLPPSNAPHSDFTVSKTFQSPKGFGCSVRLLPVVRGRGKRFKIMAQLTRSFQAVQLSETFASKVEGSMASHGLVSFVRHRSNTFSQWI